MQMLMMVPYLKTSLNFDKNFGVKLRHDRSANPGIVGSS